MLSGITGYPHGKEWTPSFTYCENLKLTVANNPQRRSVEIKLQRKSSSKCSRNRIWQRLFNMNWKAHVTTLNRQTGFCLRRKLVKIICVLQGYTETVPLIWIIYLHEFDFDNIKLLEVDELLINADLLLGQADLNVFNKTTKTLKGS